MSNGKINAKQLNGIVDITNGGTNNITFTQSQILIFGTNSISSSGYKFNDTGTTSTDIWSANKINTQIASATASTYTFVTNSIASATASTYIFINAQISSATASVVNRINGLGAPVQFLTASSDINVILNINSSGSTHSYIVGWSGLLGISRGGLNNATFTASQILIVNSGTTSIVSSGYRFNDTGTASTDIWSARQTLDNIITLTVMGGRNASISNSYLRGMDSTSFNTTPVVIPFNGTIKYISMSTNAISTWVGEVRNNGVVINGATLSTTTSLGTYSSFNINVNAGDSIQLYCNGTSVANPNMTVLITKR